MTTFSIRPQGPFSLAAAQEFAGGFAPGLGGHRQRQSGESLLMAFPLEDWTASAAVELWQDDDGVVHGDAYGAGDVDAARTQAARSLSLDHDGTGWVAVGERDPVIGRLQAAHRLLRPVCFYSAYEAATSLVIGARIAMAQGARVKRWLAETYGDRIMVGAEEVHAFPRPQRLLEAEVVPGLSAEKVRRIHAIAAAALDGRLDTQALRDLTEADALARLEELPGVGAWTAQGILMRGCGTPDTLPLGDSISRGAVQALYHLEELPDDATWLAIARAWRPYRMWATVLLHLAWRRDQASAPSYRQGRAR